MKPPSKLKLSMRREISKRRQNKSHVSATTEAPSKFPFFDGVWSSENNGEARAAESEHRGHSGLKAVLVVK
jgi:hypothetical protein